MNSPESLSELDDFARQCIHSQDHPEDIHKFQPFYCSACKSAALKLTIEHHTGSEEWDFKGIVWGECTTCGYLNRLFTFTGDSRQPLREERPVCECGGRDFMVGLCERTEGEQGIPGFFDEGVMVGKCTLCHRNRVFVYTD
ncbi:MAG: hypothetical protein E4H10_08620 [Bacteroidia bacterium]|nr:MAG: hypothetical protein E4H10_08620 [Bacteroidia bacterium]